MLMLSYFFALCFKYASTPSLVVQNSESIVPMHCVTYIKEVETRNFDQLSLDLFIRIAPKEISPKPMSAIVDGSGTTAVAMATSMPVVSH
jgi:hypothetical protein